ncbi:MAG: ATP-binding protein [Lachnospiraceae bacterium]|nr:ATP-binding protein [Lachnospiraceae bacterium]
MERNIISELLEWRDMKKGRMPLVLYGARQVGKTWLLRHFGRDYYSNTVYINFERMPVIAEYFDGDLKPDRIIRFLEEYFHTRIIPESTLLIFDEIQACERALTSLKYFAEDVPEYHIAAAGSLLGVAIHREKYSFPVGKVIMKTLYPMSFDEFLAATGNAHLVERIRGHYADMREMPAQTHAELLDLLRKYLFIGGMPAAVKAYVEELELVNIPDVQDTILNSYIADMSKYASYSDSTKIQSAFRSLPAQLAKDNRKFQYKLIRKGATSGLFGDSIAWLVMAGVALECDRVTRGVMPVKLFRDVSSFKLYMADVGLLCAFSGIMPENIARQDLSDIFKGALAENYTAQTLKASGYELHYWTSDSPAAEVDFVIQKAGKVIPIEVKYDQNVHSKSLKHYEKLYRPGQVLRLSTRNFGAGENGVTAVPLYAAFCI